MIQINQIRMTHSEQKQFALEVLEIFDQLARPELKNSVMIRIWGWVKGYTQKIILKKPDSEITESLLIIQKKLNSRFQDLSNSVEINKAEKLGAVKIPMVGDLARVKNLTKVNVEQAQKLAKELF